MLRTVALVGLALCFSMSTNANAAFIFGVDSSTPSPVSPGSAGNIRIFVNNTGAAAQADTVQINMSVDAINGANLSQLLISPVATNTGAISGPFNTQSSQTATAPYTYFLGGSTILLPPATLASGRTDLFTIPYTIGAGATPGQYTFDIVSQVVTTGPGANPPTSLSFAGNSLSPEFSGLEFSLSVAAVPEPASLGLGALALAGAGGAVRRFRNRKKASC